MKVTPSQTILVESLGINTPDGSSWYLRPLENTTDRAANQQAELLGKEHPGDLTKCWVCLTLQVQNCRSKKGDAESKAEENTPVGQCVMSIPFEQSNDPLIHKHLGNNKDNSVKGGFFFNTVSICDSSFCRCLL